MGARRTLLYVRLHLYLGSLRGVEGRGVVFDAALVTIAALTPYDGHLRFSSMATAFFDQVLHNLLIKEVVGLPFTPLAISCTLGLAIGFWSTTRAILASITQILLDPKVLLLLL